MPSPQAECLVRVRARVKARVRARVRVRVQVTVRGRVRVRGRARARARVRPRRRRAVRSVGRAGWGGGVTHGRGAGVARRPLLPSLGRRLCRLVLVHLLQALHQRVADRRLQVVEVPARW